MADRHGGNEPLKFPILIGDIGGTNARFAILLDAVAEPMMFPVVQTADFATIDDAIQASVLDKTSIQPHSAVLAVAGPVDGDEIDLTNCPWVVRPRQMLTGLGLGEVIVLNDFEAQALAISSLPETARTQIGGGIVHEGASRAVLGPGTGLGVAGLVRARNIWIPVAGEGGHIDLGPRTARDLAIWPHLNTIEGRVSGEQVLCGRGLVNLYQAIAAANGTRPIHTTPAEITDAAVHRRDEASIEAVDLFATYLGRVAGDIALIFMARGGVFIAGGIVQRIIPILKADQIRAAFEDKAPHSALLRDIPLYVVTEPLAALAGLAAFARTPRFFGLETTGRRWVAFQGA